MIAVLRGRPSPQQTAIQQVSQCLGTLTLLHGWREQVCGRNVLGDILPIKLSPRCYLPLSMEVALNLRKKVRMEVPK